MGIPEELYTALLDVGYALKRHTSTGRDNLRLEAKVLINCANKSLQDWRADSQTMERFAVSLLHSYRYPGWGLHKYPEQVVIPFVELIGLLEYIAHVDDRRSG